MTLSTPNDPARQTPLVGLDDALVRLRRLWSSPRQVIDHHGRPIEMSSVLVVEACARGAAAGHPVSVTDVASFADVAASTASRLVDRAVRAQLLQRGSSHLDARRSTLQLTPAGRDFHAHARRTRMDWLSSVVQRWPQQDLATLAELLGRFADSIAQAGPPLPGRTEVDPDNG